MGIRRYEQEDYELIASWYEARGKNRPNPDVLSDVGFIVDERVAGFLYTTNSNIGMIEGVISDPNTIPSLRRNSLQKLCNLLVETLLMLGYTNIVGITNHPAIARICSHMGFKETNMKAFVLSEPEEALEEDGDILKN